MTDYLAERYPELAARLPRTALADLPTPVGDRDLRLSGAARRIGIKYDNLTSRYYGGNKLRKLEYLLRRAGDRGAQRVATFGTVGSHHALATALYARQLGLGCTCLLSHQPRTPGVTSVLGQLLHSGSEIVCYRGDYAARVAIMRNSVQGRDTWVIPLGGSSWLGAVGYVNAGLELAAQIAAGDATPPTKIYMAAGTMGSAAGLALGLALAGADAEVQAVRVSPSGIMNSERLSSLMRKTAVLLNRVEPRIPADLAERSRIAVRHEFFGDGYAKSTPATDAAIAMAREQLGLDLESTYTGKAMAALVHDAGLPQYTNQALLFWNTYNSNPLPHIDESALDTSRLPSEFLRYFD